MRPYLEQRLSVDLQLFYTQTFSFKPSGMGVDPDASFGTSGSYDFFTLVDLERLVGWRETDFLFRTRGLYDASVNDDVGALSDPIDDADFDQGIYVDELWLQRAFFDRRLRLRVGFMEQQTVFDRNAYANGEDLRFPASFLDNNPVVPLPNALAVVLFAVPAPWLELAASVADGDNEPRDAGFETFFDGVESLNAYVEATLRSPWRERGLPGSLRIGAFRDGRRRVDFRTGRRGRGHYGVFVSFDQQVWGDAEGDGPALGLFGRFGWSDPDVSRIEWFWSTGLEWAGGLPGRPRDRLGLGVYQAIISDELQDAAGVRLDRETGFDLYYAIQALGWLVVTPDLQYIVDPGARGDVDDVFVGTLRIRVAF